MDRGVHHGEVFRHLIPNLAGYAKVFESSIRQWEGGKNGKVLEESVEG